MIDKNNLNGWSLSEEAVEWILKNIPKYSTILELGSGTGTIELCKNYNVWSIEHNKDWIGLSKKSNYIYSPLKSYLHSNKSYIWYNDSFLKKLPKDYQLLIIDGPPGDIRGNFIYFNRYFKKDIPILIDDTNRLVDKKLAEDLSKIMNKEILEIKGYEKEMIVLV